MDSERPVPPPALLRSLRTIAPYFTPDAMRLALIAGLAIGSASGTICAYTGYSKLVFRQ